MNKKDLINRIENCEFFFEDFTEEEIEIYNKDTDVMLSFIKIDSLNIGNVDKSLFNNEDFLKECIKEDTNDVIGEYIPDIFLRDKKFMSYATNIQGNLISYSPLVKDKKFIIELMFEGNVSLDNLPQEMIEDREIVMAALDNLTEWDRFLTPLSETYLGDKDFVETYLTEAYEILNYITEDLKKDQDLMIKIISENPNPIYMYDMHDSLKENINILNSFIEYKPDAFVSFSDSIKMNTDLVGSWVKNDLSLLTYVSEDVYLNKNFLIQIKENFLKDEKYHIVYPVILEAIKAYEREDFLHENLNKKDHKIRKNKKKI